MTNDLNDEKRTALQEIEADIESAKRLGSLPAESLAAIEKTAADLRAELAKPIDFSVNDQGSIVILTANTEAAREWVEEHLPADRQTWGRHGTVIEHRYADDIINGLQADGLTVE